MVHIHIQEATLNVVSLDGQTLALVKKKPSRHIFVSSLEPGRKYIIEEFFFDKILFLISLK